MNYAQDFKRFEIIAKKIKPLFNQNRPLFHEHNIAKIKSEDNLVQVEIFTPFKAYGWSKIEPYPNDFLNDDADYIFYHSEYYGGNLTEKKPPLKIAGKWQHYNNERFEYYLSNAIKIIIKRI